MDPLSGHGSTANHANHAKTGLPQENARNAQRNDFEPAPPDRGVQGGVRCNRVWPLVQLRPLGALGSFAANLTAVFRLMASTRAATPLDYLQGAACFLGLFIIVRRDAIPPAEKNQLLSQSAVEGRCGVSE